MGQRSAHKPQCRQTSSSFTITRPVLQLARHVEVLLAIQRRCRELLAQIGFVVVRRERNAVHRTDVDARVALDTQLVGEHGLHVAIQAALRFARATSPIEAEFDFHLDVLQRFARIDVRHQMAFRRVVLAVVAPLVHAHLLAEQVDALGRTIRLQIQPLTEQMNRNRCFVRVCGRPDDVLGTERRVAAEEHVRQRRLQRVTIEHRTFPAIELDADVALDPRAVVFLTNRHQHVIGFHEDIRLAGRYGLAAARCRR